MKRTILLLALALSALLAVSVADAAPGARGCGGVDGNTNVTVSGASCHTAIRLVAHSSNGEKPIPGTDHRGFTLRGYTCRVRSGGGQKSDYRCHRGRVVVTWSYQP